MGVEVFGCNGLADRLAFGGCAVCREICHVGDCMVAFCERGLYIDVGAGCEVGECTCLCAVDAEAEVHLTLDGVALNAH